MTLDSTGADGLLGGNSPSRRHDGDDGHRRRQLLSAPTLADVLAILDRAQYDNADAFVVVTVDDDTGAVFHATGPFDEPEQALIEAGRADAEWKRHAAPDEGTFTYVVVPLWSPGQ